MRALSRGHTRFPEAPDHPLHNSLIRKRSRHIPNLLLNLRILTLSQATIQPRDHFGESADVPEATEIRYDSAQLVDQGPLLLAVLCGLQRGHSATGFDIGR